MLHRTSICLFRNNFFAPLLATIGATITLSQSILWWTKGQKGGGGGGGQARINRQIQHCVERVERQKKRKTTCSHAFRGSVCVCVCEKLKHREQKNPKQLYFASRIMKIHSCAVNTVHAYIFRNQIVTFIFLMPHACS